MFFSSKLNKFKNIKHCFFSRKNGTSSGIYKSLNCSLGSNDKKDDVLKNIELVSKKIGCKKESIITLNQIHSSKVIYFENGKSIKNRLTGDAIISNVTNVGIGVLAADCAPILFYDPNTKLIGCAHSGWKGALNGIITNTVKKFNELNSKSEDLIAVIGPCLNENNYEVEIDFLNNFIKKNKDNKKFFRKISSKKFLFDLRSFINNEILSLGIKNIENIKIDTFSEKEFFYSYRRSQHNKEKDYGRCISVILMT